MCLYKHVYSDIFLMHRSKHRGRSEHYTQHFNSPLASYTALQETRLIELPLTTQVYTIHGEIF